MRGAVDAAGQARQHGDVGARQLGSEATALLEAVGRGAAGAHDGNRTVVGVYELAAKGEEWGAVVDEAEIGRVGIVEDGDEAEAGTVEVGDGFGGALEVVGRYRGG